MIAAWMIYALLVGLLVGGGALALEKLLRGHSLPSRWLWAGALLLSSAWPIGHLVVTPSPGEVGTMAVPEPPPGAIPDFLPAALPLDLIAVQVPEQSVLRSMDGPIIMGWALATGILLFLLLVLVLRTRRVRNGWRKGVVGGQAVLLSREWGPGVVGFLRPQIVLPDWCREMEERALEFILEHEVEHIRARDLTLVLSAALLPVLLPWHLPLWWQLGRLRLAVEGDCDLRVVKGDPGRVRPYLELLLEVGEGITRQSALAIMLSEPYVTLKRRIRIMTMPNPKKPWLSGTLLAGAGALLVALACWAPGPTDAEDEGLLAPAQAAEASTATAQNLEMLDQIFANGYRNGIQQEEWELAARTLRRGLELATEPGDRSQFSFWLGYALLKQAAREQEPNTLETARSSLPRFQEALRLLEGAEAYAREQDMEATREQLMRNSRTYIEIQEAIIRRDR